MSISLEAAAARAETLPPQVSPAKLDFLLGRIQRGPAAEKSAQRGYDFVERLGYNRRRLCRLLEQQIRAPNRNKRAIDVRDNPHGGPLLRLGTSLVAPSGITIRLVSIWEIKQHDARFVTAWAEIFREE